MVDKNVILELKNVTKMFSGITAAQNVNISVPPKYIYGIIGPNGAGKTTLFNMITGIYDVSSGEILLDRGKINGLKIHNIANLGVARTFQNIRLFGELSVYDNVLTACHKSITYGLLNGLLRTAGCKRQEREAEEICRRMLCDAGLEPYSTQKADNLPYGLQRRLEIVRGLATMPKILLLDEPAAGMNEEESRWISGYIREIRQSYGITIVVIDHHMDVIMNVCDRISVMNFGTVLAEGTPSEIQKDKRVIEAYLGADD